MDVGLFHTKLEWNNSNQDLCNTTILSSSNHNKYNIILPDTPIGNTITPANKGFDYEQVAIDTRPTNDRIFYCFAITRLLAD
jgi:hypothetical protein